MKHFLLTFLSAIQTIMFWILFGTLFDKNNRTILIIILIALIILSCIGSTKFRLLNKFKMNYFLLELALTPVTIIRQLFFAIIRLLEKPGFIVDENSSCLDYSLTKKQRITQFLFCFYYEEPIK